MAKNEPIDPRVRLAISQWPPDAPRGAVTSFCLEHAISRKTFYELRKRARVGGPAAVLEPRSRRPKSSPSKISDEVKKQAVQVRASLQASGLDHGPISVHDKMRAMGLEQVPSIASLARIFRQAGVARVEPKKKPRAAYRRFVYPAPNACWQLDATQYVLTRGRTCVIFQLLDDHSRLALASHVAWGETAQGAIDVLDKAIAVHGVPQRLLTDNGAALNPTRRGHTGQLVAHVTRLGVQAITGKPYKPTTQGKNERFHQTLLRYLDTQPIAESLAELQAQVDQFDHIYNTLRPHQGLPGRITPLQAWQATPKADPPRPEPERPPILDKGDRPPALPQAHLRRLHNNGALKLRGVAYMVDRKRAREEVIFIEEGNKITIADLQGTILIEHTHPAPGITYVSNGRPPGPRRKTPPTTPMS